MADRSEQELIARCRRGDQDAFRELVAAHQHMVFGLLARTVDDPSAVEDLAQDVFLRVYRGLPYFRGDARIGTWIYRIVANVVAQHHAGRRPAEPSLDERDEDGGTKLEPGAVDRQFSDLELRERLEKALATLPPAYRLVLASHYFQDMGYEELAVALGMPLGTVKTHLHRAKRLLRERLSGER